MSFWYPRLNASGVIAGGNGVITTRQPNGAVSDIGVGHSPQWMGDPDDNQLLVGGRADGTVILNAQTGLVQQVLGVDCNPRTGNTSGICAGKGHWCGWNNAQGLVYDGVVIDPGAAPGVVDLATGALSYLAPYQANSRNVVINGAVLRYSLATEMIAGERAVTWGEYEAVRRLYGWHPETGVLDLSPLPETEYLFTGIPVATPSGLWLVTGTHAGLIVYPWGESEGYILEGPAQFPDARWVNGKFVIVSTNDRGGLQQYVVDLTAHRYNLTQYYPTTGGYTPEPPDPPIPPVPPEDEVKPPSVTVDTWTLDQVDNGKQFVFHDAGNPELGYQIRVWVEGESMYASIANKAGQAQTGAVRQVHPCASQPTPPDPPIPPIPPDPPKVEKFTLKRHDGGFLAVGPNAVLVQNHTAGAAFEYDAATLGLKANGKYCAAEDGSVKADRDSVGSDWEQWDVATGDDSTSLSLLSKRFGLYLSAHDDGVVAADQPVVGGWETFTVGEVLGPELHGRLRCDGRMLRDDVDYYRPVWTDALDALTIDYVPLLDWAVAMGFGGVRVFCGNTGRGNNQTPESAAHCLPGFLDAARARGLRVEVTALTGTESGYNAAAYVAQIAAICQPYENAICEEANEPWHPSQKDLTPDYLMSMQPSVPDEVISALGAAESDESSEYAGGPYITAHLDRSRDEWNMVRRVRELEALSVANGKFVLNNEPIKAGSQNNNPAIFFTMAVLNRGFEVGGVYHSDDGLAGRVPAPGSEQQTLAEAYIRGAKVITTKQRMTYKNAGWHDSPVKEFTGAVRVYSFMADQSVAVALGIEVPGVTEGSFSITMQNGWKLGPILDEMPNVRVYQLVQ